MTLPYSVHNSLKSLVGYLLDGNESYDWWYGYQLCFI